jgi:ribosomal protein L37AE/L43A
MSEHPHQVCRFCHRNVKLAYYCEECGASCCSDCLNEEKIDYFICEDCNSKNIEILESGKRKRCKDCGKENIHQINQLLKSCPKCHSTVIINIYEKKDNLEKLFLDLIKRARDFLDPLNELVNNLTYLRQKVFNARASPIRCFHFPHMESELLSLFKLFIYARDNIQEKISILFHHISLNKDYFFDINSQPNSNVIIIEDILENLTRNYNSIDTYVKSNVNTINESLSSIQKNLKFIDKISSYFNKYKKYLNLAEDEKPIYAIHAKLANGLNSHDKFKKNRGMLFITNFDLSFVHEYGRFKKKKELDFKAPVKDLTKLKIKGRVFKRLYIEFAYGRYEFSLLPNSITAVKDYIILARNFQESIIFDEDSSKKLNEIDLDLMELMNYIEEAITSFFSSKISRVSDDYACAQHPSNFPSSQTINPPYFYNPDPNINMTQHHAQNPYQLRNNTPQYPYSNNMQPVYSLNPYFDQRQPSCIQDDFYIQNLYNPKRVQNYPSPLFIDGYQNQSNSLEDKELLYRKLEQFQKSNPNPQASFNPDPNLFIDRNKSLGFYNHLNRKSFPSFEDYSRFHLSQLFNGNEDQYLDKSYPKNISRRAKTKLKKMHELEEERYGIEETLKALDDKFEQGIISEADYFRNYKNLQKQIYSIEKKIDELDADFSQNNSLKKVYNELDKRRYYT